MEAGQLIRTARQGKRLSQRELAKRLGVTRQTVASWEHPTRPKVPKRTHALSLAKELDLPLSAIWGDHAQVNVAAFEIGALNARHVPLISWVQAGRGAEVVAAYAADKSHEFIPTNFPVSEKSFALIVKGDSMEPKFHEGDIIVVDPNREPLNDEYVVAELLPEGTAPGGGQATFKQYRARSSIGMTRVFDLIPLNDEYPTQTINKNNPGRIIGTVTELHRDLRR